MINVIAILCLTFFLNSEVIATALQHDSIQSIKTGNHLFRTSCSTCHSIHHENIGPMLASITKKKSRTWLTRFIRNSQDVIASGDVYANLLYRNYNHVMPSFTELSDDDIHDILNYLESNSTSVINEMAMDNEIMQNSNPEILYGRQLFRQQCASCHSIYHESYGPALGSVTKRLPKAWLIPFVRNSQKVIEGGDPYALPLFNSFNHRIMVSMDFLNEEQINSILTYIEFASTLNYSPTNEMEHKESTNPVVSIDGNILHNQQGYNNSDQTFKVAIVILLISSLSVFGFILFIINKYLRREHLD
ncbi:MAG TPA: cytochrome c [Cyclobacteriaceae bacterium]|nr:cytochrome c [Cyclobacteriaceae bacterium]